jgi:hypothetical protein
MITISELVMMTPTSYFAIKNFIDQFLRVNGAQTEKA